MTTSQGMVERQVALGFDTVMARLPGLLGHEGFGVVTELDLPSIFQQKLGAPFRRYRVLGVCSPHFAFRAVSEHPEAGVLLPCNVAVYELEGGGTQVVAADPMAQAARVEHDLADVATEVRHRLEKVVAAL